MATRGIRRRAALAHLLELLRIEGLSGREGEVVRAVTRKARAAGCSAEWIRVDDAPRRMRGDFETGNLIVRLPGTVRGPRRLFVAHLDTVPLCRAAVPLRRGGRIVSRDATGLGADNRTAVACLVTVLETILRDELDHPPLTFLFTVGEEVGLQGSRAVRLTDLGRPALGFNVDGGRPAKFVIGAVGAERWQAELLGRAAHAGVHPEHGVSATLIAALALRQVAVRGYFGKIRRGAGGTSNVGVIRGGEATNQVTERVWIEGESRSHDPRFVRRISAVYREEFERAARGLRNNRGARGRVRFRARVAYEPFRLDEGEPVVRLAVDSANKLRLEPELVVVDGGLDANQLNARGVPTITLGAGQHRPHTLEEYVDVDEYLGGCRLALRLATVRAAPAQVTLGSPRATGRTGR